MKIIDRKKRFVKIIIGEGSTGDTGISKPIMSLRVEGTTVQQMYEKIFDMIKKEERGNIKSKK